MDKLSALKVLIEHSFLLSEKVKAKLLLKIYSMKSEQIDEMGIFLAQEKKRAISTFETSISTYEELIKQVEKRKIT